MEKIMRVIALLREEIPQYLDENIGMRLQQVDINYEIPSNCPKCREELLDLYSRLPCRNQDFIVSLVIYECPGCEERTAYWVENIYRKIETSQ